MEPSRTARLHLEIDLEFTDGEAVQSHAKSWAQANSGENADALAGMLEQAAEGPDAALMMLVEPSQVLADIPGIQPIGATMWLEGEDGEDAGDLSEADQDQPFGDDDPWDDEEDAIESEDEWLAKIYHDGDKLPGLALSRLGYNEAESDPDLRGRQLREATMLRGALHWGYESYIDELLADVALLRETPEEPFETAQISALPPLYADSYGPLFAQRFLAVSFDLGTDLARGFEQPSCVAQELALRLLLDQVDALTSMLPNLGLAEDWRTLLEDQLFSDLDHELLYGDDGDAPDSAAAQQSVASLGVDAWFTPFANKSVNPYAAN